MFHNSHLLGAHEKAPKISDLLNSEEIRTLFGEDIVFFLQTLFGPKVGLNLRNLTWHGFLSEKELFDPFGSLLIILVFSLNSFLSSTTRFELLKPLLRGRTNLKLILSGHLSGNDNNINQNDINDINKVRKNTNINNNNINNNINNNNINNNNINNNNINNNINNNFSNNNIDNNNINNNSINKFDKRNSVRNSVNTKENSEATNSIPKYIDCSIPKYIDCSLYDEKLNCCYPLSYLDDMNLELVKEKESLYDLIDRSGFSLPHTELTWKRCFQYYIEKKYYYFCLLMCSLLGISIFLFLLSYLFLSFSFFYPIYF
jgi:hypothetical protein